MRPSLAKEVARSNSAYGFGRTAVDICLIIEFLGFIGSAVAVLWSQVRPTREDNTWFVVGCVLVSILAILAVIAQREIIHAVFDIADSAVKKGRENQGGNADNPFIDS